LGKTFLTFFAHKVEQFARVPRDKMKSEKCGPP